MWENERAQEESMGTVSSSRPTSTSHTLKTAIFSPRVVYSVALEYKLSWFFITYVKPVRWIWLALVLVSLVLWFSK